MMSNIYYYLSFQKEVIFAEKFWQEFFFFSLPILKKYYKKSQKLEPAKI